MTCIFPSLIVSTFLGQFLDTQKVSEDLHAFAKLNERRLYKLLTTCMDPQTDLKSLVKATVSSPQLNACMIEFLVAFAARIFEEAGPVVSDNNLHNVGVPPTLESTSSESIFDTDTGEEDSER
jgi:hypothetical protein